MPKVSIGLPVYNGEKYLKEAIDSILVQTFEDFELIIFDNSSNDNTSEICKKYAAQDKRIQYFRGAENIGAAKNFNRTFHLSTGRYFKWAAHDDVCLPEYLSKCVEVLDNDDSIVLCYPKTKIIDEYGNIIGDDRTNLNVSFQEPYKRFREIVLKNYPCFQIFGLMRKGVLQKTSLIEGYSASDRVLLAELALHNRFYEIPEYLFLNRNHPDRSSIAYDRRSRAIWFNPLNAKKKNFLIGKIFYHYFSTVIRVRTSWTDKMHCLTILMAWLTKNWKGLLYDLKLRIVG